MKDSERRRIIGVGPGMERLLGELCRPVRFGPAGPTPLGESTVPASPEAFEAAVSEAAFDAELQPPMPQPGAVDEVLAELDPAIAYLPPRTPKKEESDVLEEAVEFALRAVGGQLGELEEMAKRLEDEIGALSQDLTRVYSTITRLRGAQEALTR